MLPMVAFDKSAFVKFKISNNFKTTKNPQEIPNQPMDFKNLKKMIREPKVSRLLPNLYDFQFKNP
jgi:hypothetical protein